MHGHRLRVSGPTVHMKLACLFALLPAPHGSIWRQKYHTIFQYAIVTMCHRPPRPNLREESMFKHEHLQGPLTTTDMHARNSCAFTLLAGLNQMKQPANSVHVMPAILTSSLVQVWDKERVVLMPEHYIFTEDPRANRNVDVLREYAQKYDIKYFYDITDRSDFKANPDYRGVCHIALAEEAHTMPGEVMFGTDSHTCNAGAFGMFATGIGNTDAGFVLGTGKLLVKVPPTLRFNLEGEIPPYITAKDIILHIIGEIGVRSSS